MYKDSIQALKAFKESPEAFDLVVTDMAMPGMTGDILARHLKACKKDIPVILCTGFSEKISQGTYHESDIDEFLMKPFSIAKFIGTVRKILDNRG
nr:response regulator [Desulforapulum autotrophicum]